MKKLAIWIALLLAAICTLASCDKVLDDGPLTQEQIFDGKTVKDIYGQSVNKYNSHKGEKIPFSVELVMTSIDNGNEKLELSLICDKENVSYNMSENSVSEEINFVDGKLYFKYTDGCKELYDSNRESVFEYIDGTTAVKGLEAAFPHDLPESWFNDLQFTADGDGYKVEINVDKNKANEHKKYPEFFKNGGVCKIYFDESYVLDRVEFLGATVGGKLCNITVSYSWAIDIGLSEPTDKENFSYKGTFDPQKKHEHDQYSQGLEFTSNGDGTCYVSGIGTCTDTDIKIPTVSPDGDHVTGIGWYAFQCCTSLSSVTIPDSVTSIGASAFFSCRSLTSVTIGSEVTSIDSWAFGCCDSLTSITIPDSVTSIGGYAFVNCISITSITIPSSVTHIDSGAFACCESLTSITIPDSITSISNNMFEGCTSLTSVTIPDSVTSIDNSAFTRCKGLTSVTIGNGVTTIELWAFEQCTSLTSITIPDSVTSIDNYAFAYCSSLTNVYYKGSEEDWAKITIGSSNEYLINATRYYYSETQPTTEGNFWHYVDGVPTPWPVYSDPTECQHSWSDLEKVPNESDACVCTLEVVYCHECSSCGEIQFIVEDAPGHVWGEEQPAKNGTGIPDCQWMPVYIAKCEVCNHNECMSVRTEGSPLGHSYTDGKCIYCGEADPDFNPSTPIYSQGLEFTLSADGRYYIVSGIGTCTDKNIKLPSTYNGLPVSEISSNAFYNTGIKGLYISKNINKMPHHLIEVNNLIESLNVDAENPYFYAENNCIIQKGTNTLVLGCNSSVIPDYVDTIGVAAFCGCSLMTSIDIPSSVKHIQKDAFYLCKNLKTINLLEGLVSIGDWAFYDCYALESIYIPSTVESIDKYAYFLINSVVSIIVHEDNIYYHSENNCLIETSSNTLLFGCKTSVIPDYVTNISTYAFRERNHLGELVIPKSVINIEDNAFYNSPSLTTVYYTGGEEDWAKITIGSSNEHLINATRYYYSETEPTAEGNFWHYVDGVPTAWSVTVTP